METIKLSQIVLRFTPEMYPSLKKVELNTDIVLRDGIEALEAQDALEIIKHSIAEHQRHSIIH